MLDPAHDGLEYSVMSYRSYLGGPASYYTVETWGYPQSLMMLDLAAIQDLYGADYTSSATNTTYRFDPLTGEMTVNGVSAGVPGANRVFRTLWDGGGVDTIDLSNYATDLRVDLNPGKGVDLNVTGYAQRARLGTDAAGTAIYAAHHIYMSLLHNGDTRSLIENATGGTGDDTLIGNQAANLLAGGAGDDSLTGGLGADRFVLGKGADTVTDTLAGLDGDTIADFDVALDRIVVEGATLAAGAVSYDALTGRLALDADGNGSAEAVLWLAPGLAVPGITLTTAGTGTEISLAPNAGSGGGGSNPAATSVTLTTSADIYVNASGTNLTVWGLAGADQITTGSGTDTIWGGTEADKLSGMGGTDTLWGEAGADTLWGGDGSDTLWGGSENDKLYGEAGADRIHGDAGTDTLWGGDDDDLIWGDAGTDTLWGGNGDDTLWGGSENDKLYGEAGNDVLATGTGAKDYMTGGAGNDRFVIDAADFTAGVSGSRLRHRLHLRRRHAEIHRLHRHRADRVRPARHQLGPAPHPRHIELCLPHRRHPGPDRRDRRELRHLPDRRRRPGSRQRCGHPGEPGRCRRPDAGAIDFALRSTELASAIHDISTDREAGADPAMSITPKKVASSRKAEKAS